MQVDSNDSQQVWAASVAFAVGLLTITSKDSEHRKSFWYSADFFLGTLGTPSKEDVPWLIYIQVAWMRP